jgi:arylsulfatase A-like enzyme/tetratricopeptide (TPR) repeat protein
MAVRTRGPLSTAISLLALGLSLGLTRVPGVFASAGARRPRLNVLLVTIDTLRADRLGAYGSKRLLTPNLDELAARSSVFARAYAHTTTTLPSHTNILLGLTPPYHGVHDNLNFVVRPEFVTLAEHLGGQGYATGAFIGGFPLVSHFGLDQGFSVYDDSFGTKAAKDRAADFTAGERPAAEVWASARRWLRGRSSPWFLWVHFYDPHEPYAPPEPYRTRFARSPYDGEVAYADAVFGDILKELRDRGLEGTTLVVCVGDHGESLGEHNETSHGFEAYNTTLWIPLIVYVPGLAPRVIGQNVSHIDLFPTVCDVVGIDRPKQLQGRSLLPLMRGQKLPDRPVYFESLAPYYNMGWAPLRGFIDQQTKFIDSPRPEVYDLRRDFAETDNRAGEGGVSSLKKRLDAMVLGLTSPESAKAEQASDRTSLEKLRSLGYVASLPGRKRTDFGPEDSVGALLPYHNRAVEALELHKAGKTAEAVAVLREVLSARRTISAAYLNLAAIYRDQDRMDDAIAVLRGGLEALPENYDLFFQLLTDLLESGQFGTVLAAFEGQAFPQVEFDPVIWNCVGLAQWKTGQTAEALASLKKALAIDGAFAVTYHNLGTIQLDIFQRTGRPESRELAVADFRKAVSLDPTYSPALYSLGVAYLQGSDFGRAIESLDQALALDPGLDEAHFFLGSAHLSLGHRSLAYEHLMKYRGTRTFDRLPPAAKKGVEDLLAACRQGK